VEVIGWWISLLVVVEDLVVARDPVGKLEGEIHSVERLVLGNRCENLFPFVRRILIGFFLENDSLSQVTTVQKLGQSGAGDY
jgi:hypothetical protein